MKTFIISLSLVLTTTVNFGAVVRDTATILFETDQFSLDEQAKKDLSRIASIAPVGSDVQIIVHGHTDSRGSDEYNRKLSKQRSLSVKDFLTQMGIIEDRISLDFSGEQLPVKPNSNAKNMQENRRLEVSFGWFSFDDIEQLEQELRSGRTQTFTVNPEIENIVTGKGGTRLLIEANAFVDANGNSIQEPIQVNLIEALSMEAFIMNGLATISDDHLLESGGMIKLEANTLNGHQVLLNAKSPISVSIPSDRILPGMELFLSSNGDNWSKTGAKIGDSIGYKMPPYPKFEILEFKAPVYRPDLSSKPKKPLSPGYLKKPNAPRRESYMPKEKWHSQITEKQKRQHFESSYQSAQQDYLNRLDVYEQSKRDFSADSNQYELDMVQYAMDLVLWEKMMVDEGNDFQNSPDYLEAVRVHKSLTALANVDYQEKVIAWKALRKQRQDEAFAKMEKLNLGNQALLDQYAFSVNQLSWINVDRFYKEDMSQIRQVAVRDNDTSPERVFIVFKEMQSVLPMAKSEMMYVQDRIPMNVSAEVFAYKVINGQAHMFHQAIGEEPILDFSFQPCAFTDIKNKLIEFNTNAS